jgi:anti-sigma B factor antagonist
VIAVSENDGAVVLEVQGDITDAVMDEFSGLVGELVDRRKVRVVLSVRRVGRVSLKAIKWLAGNLRRLRQRDGDMRLAGLSPYWTSLLELTENQNMFLVFPSVDEAVASYRGFSAARVPAEAGLVSSAAG